MPPPDRDLRLNFVKVARPMNEMQVSGALSLGITKAVFQCLYRTSLGVPVNPEVHEMQRRRSSNSALVSSSSALLRFPPVALFVGQRTG